MPDNDDSGTEDFAWLEEAAQVFFEEGETGEFRRVEISPQTHSVIHNGKIILDG